MGRWLVWSDALETLSVCPVEWQIAGVTCTNYLPHTHWHSQDHITQFNYDEHQARTLFSRVGEREYFSFFPHKFPHVISLTVYGTAAYPQVNEL